MDLSLDLSSPASTTYRDLVFVNGDLVATRDQNPAGTNPILQSMLQRLGTWRGEWFLNTKLGVPYYQQILIKNPNRATVDTQIQAVILGTPGCLRLTQYQSTWTSVSRLVSIRFTAATTQGIVRYDGPLSTPTAQVTA